MFRRLVWTAQLALAVLLGFGLRALARDYDDALLPCMGAAFLSVLVPRRWKWISLAAWAVFWCLWSGYEFDLWRRNASKFGEAAYLYSAVAALFALAAYLKFRQIARGGPPQIATKA